jgi:aminoglycoside phosphotransferase family enzyme
VVDRRHQMTATGPLPLHLRIKQMLEAGRGSAEQVTMTETRKSWIFLTPHHAYKLKKRVRDDLQDLTSLSARLDNSLVEIDLNRRLALPIYLGVVKLCEDESKTLHLDGPGQIIDWLVKMQRMPESRMLEEMIAVPTDQKALGPGIDRLADTLVEFYKSAPRSHLKATELVTILQSQQDLIAVVLFDPLFAAHHARFSAIFTAYDAAFDRFFSQYDVRAAQGWIRECHGDLRPEHICLTDPPLIFDCLEFNRNLRLLDPFQELAQLGLETDILGAAWIKPRLIDAVADGLGHKPSQDLLDFYQVSHALLRMRLCLAHLLVPEPRKPKKWLPLALRYCEMAERLLGARS